MSSRASHPFQTSRATLMILWLAISLLLYGVTIGLYWLIGFWGGVATGWETLYPLHPSMMLGTVSTLFVMGVAYTLLPTFWGRLPERRYAYPGLAMFLAGESLLIVSVSIGMPIYESVYLSLAGVAIFIYAILRIVRFDNEIFTYSDLYIATALVILPIYYINRVYRVFSGSTPLITGDPATHHLLITGFILPMIIGVSTRTMKFKFTFVDRRWMAYSYLSFLLGLTLLVPTWVLGVNQPIWIYPVIFAVVFYSYAYNVFELRPGKPYEDRMKERDWIRYIFFRRHVNMGGLWLLTGYTLLMLYLTGPYPVEPRFLWDASTHSIMLGFTANYVVAYAGIMLPPITLRKAPYKALKPYTLIALNTAVALRVATDFIPLLRSELMAWIHASLIYLAVTLFAVMMINLVRE